MSNDFPPPPPSMTDEEFRAFDTWLKLGRERGYISRVFCNTHDGYPMPEWEEEEWSDGLDPCCFAVRLYGPYYPYGPDDVASDNA